ncbi:MAG: hypothetical protein M9927_07765 [Anaerolineae bacterium]|nr:hypothetical protein [Anaerolineae bacterium]
MATPSVDDGEQPFWQSVAGEEASVAGRGITALRTFWPGFMVSGSASIPRSRRMIP